MPDSGPVASRLDVLRQRWEEDPSSRLFLQLAEEYRRLGHLEEAARILEAGLEAQPRYLSAQVALGRCRLEMGEPELASAVLERAVEQDVTQMVANKLLVEAYLRMGLPQRARERLDIYRQLNDSDPEIDGLEQRLEALAPAAGERVTPATSAAARGTELGVPPASGALPGREETVAGGRVSALRAVPSISGGDVFQLPRSTARPFDLAEVGVRSSALSRTVERRLQVRAGGTPFAGLTLHTDRERALSALGAEGIFPLVQLRHSSRGAVEAAPAPVVEVEPSTPRPVAVESSPRPAEPEEAEEEIQVPVETDSTSEVVAPEEAEAFAAERPAVVESDPPKTATLGEIYLAQGHLEEAERIFRAVLERDPENQVASRGLERLAAARLVERHAEVAEVAQVAEVAAAPAAARENGSELVAAAPETAEDAAQEAPIELAPPVIAPAPPETRRDGPAGNAQGAGLTGKKIQVLSRYLRQIRRKGGSDVS